MKKILFHLKAIHYPTKTLPITIAPFSSLPKGKPIFTINDIEVSTPHAYWLARSFVLLSDVYVKLDRKMEAKQYLLSLQQNYQANDDIAGMIESRLAKLKSVK